MQFTRVLLASLLVDQGHPDRDDVDRSGVGFVLASVASCGRDFGWAAGHARGDFADVVGCQVRAVDHAVIAATSPS